MAVHNTLPCLHFILVMCCYQGFYGNSCTVAGVLQSFICHQSAIKDTSTIYICKWFIVVMLIQHTATHILCRFVCIILCAITVIIFHASFLLKFFISSFFTMFLEVENLQTQQCYVTYYHVQKYSCCYFKAINEAHKQECLHTRTIFK